MSTIFAANQMREIKCICATMQLERYKLIFKTLSVQWFLSRQ